MGVNARSLYRETRRRGIFSVAVVVGDAARGQEGVHAAGRGHVDTEIPSPEFRLRFTLHVCPRTNVQTCLAGVIRIIA